MNIFVDSSAFFAMLELTDENHGVARSIWSTAIQEEATLICTNYVVLETLALVQSRAGMSVLRSFCDDVLPFLKIIWIDEAIHHAGINAVLSANRRELSMVDCTSFAAMRDNGLDTAFAFDRHFDEQGYRRLT